LYFLDTGDCRSYNPKGLTLVDKHIADILTATHYEKIRREI